MNCSTRVCSVTAWMALFCQNMLEIGVELAVHDATLEELAAHVVNQFPLIARAMNGMGENGMWDEDDGFYYDLLRLPNGQSMCLKVRSAVGLLPLCAATVVEPWQRERVPNLLGYFMNELRRKPELLATMHATGPGHLGVAERGMLALVNQDRLRRILTRVLDEHEFLSPYGIRALSGYHADHPYTFSVDGGEYRVGYLPAKSDTGMFGGNEIFQTDPHWRDHLLFYEYFHGDNGAGIGAVIAHLLHRRANTLIILRLGKVGRTGTAHFVTMSFLVTGASEDDSSIMVAGNGNPKRCAYIYYQADK